jgi:hypothetical protein
VQALRVLRDKFPQIVDAMEPGGTGGPFAGPWLARGSHAPGICDPPFHSDIVLAQCDKMIQADAGTLGESA